MTRIIHRRRRTLLWSLTALLGAGAVLALPLAGITLAGALAVLTVVLLQASTGTSRAAIRRRLVAFGMQAQHLVAETATTTRFTEAGIESVRPGLRHWLSWPALTRVVARRGLLVLYAHEPVIVLGPGVPDPTTLADLIRRTPGVGPMPEMPAGVHQARYRVDAALLEEQQRDLKPPPTGSRALAIRVIPPVALIVAVAALGYVGASLPLALLVPVGGGLLLATALAVWSALDPRGANTTFMRFQLWRKPWIAVECRLSFDATHLWWTDGRQWTETPWSWVAQVHRTAGALVIRTTRGQVHWIKADWLDEPEQAWADIGAWWAAASRPDLIPVQVEPPDTSSVWSPPSS